MAMESSAILIRMPRGLPRGGFTGLNHTFLVKFITLGSHPAIHLTQNYSDLQNMSWNKIF
jgi:hypothetical protein